MLSRPTSISQMFKKFAKHTHFFSRSVQSPQKSKVPSCKSHYVDVLRRFERQAGVVSTEDLRRIFGSLLGYDGGDQSMAKFLASLDVKKKGIVDHDSLVAYFEHMKLPRSEEIKVQITRARGGKERFGKRDVRAVLGWDVDSRWPHYDPKEDSIEELLNDGIKIFDSDLDGMLSLEEFVDMYSCYLFVASIVSRH